jgi:hypothetical protein
MNKKKSQNMLERSEAFADSTQNRLQEIQGINPHVSGSSSEQSTQPGQLFPLSFQDGRGSYKVTTPSNLL